MAVSEALEVIVAPATTCVSVQQMRGHLRIDHEYEDETLHECIVDATDWVEQVLNRALINQTFRYSISRLPASLNLANIVIYPLSFEPWVWKMHTIQLLRPKLQSINSVVFGYQSTPSTGPITETTIDSSHYVLNPYSQPATISFDSTTTVTNLVYQNFEYVAGYGDTSDSVPPSIRRALKQVAAHLYRNRGDVESSPFIKNIHSLLANYRICQAGNPARV